MASSKIFIESRVQLFFTLAEAAELEHNFMCLYLYAVLGLKRTLDEGLNAEELEAVTRWRRVIMGVALEEMTHLTLVSNLFVAMGQTPHFQRPNFPAYPGMYPADIVVELDKFNINTLDHFIYLERPRTQEIKDGSTFKPNNLYSRVAPQGTLMPNPGDYDTVGELYQTIRESIAHLCEKVGEKSLFCGDPANQVGPLDSALPGLNIITDKESAFKAMDTIVTQGEGATQEEGSHFARFGEIKSEYLDLLKKNPTFDPSRPIVRNPVMRRPLDSHNRVLVDEPLAAKFMDLANALYIFMLKVLVQVYTIENRPTADKKELLEIAFAMMHAMAIVGETLTHMPVSFEKPEGNAGMSFAMNRSMAPVSTRGELIIMTERLQQFEKAFINLNQELRNRENANPQIAICLEQLTSACKYVHDAAARAQKVGKLNADSKLPNTSSAAADSLAAVAQSSSSLPIEVAEAPDISISFESKKCMHARHCVTQLPKVFLANTPGKWLYPESSAADELAAVILQCPSGALKYHSKSENLHNEHAPAVNVLRVRENGPYSLIADLEVDGVRAGFRATMCRCGKSKNKPYCDSSHVEMKFKSSGEPESIDTTELQARGGKLIVSRMDDGPLSLTGNLELCSGTGRVVLRTESVRLCRCGNSKSKPVCDSSHIAAGFKDTVRVNLDSPRV